MGYPYQSYSTREYCCFCLDYQAGTVIVGVLFCLEALASGMWHFPMVLNGQWMAITSLAVSLIMIVCGLLAVHGATYFKARQVMPLIVALAIHVIIVAIIIIGATAILIRPPLLDENLEKLIPIRRKMAVTVFLNVIVGLILSWFFKTVYNCYDYLCSAKSYGGYSNGSPIDYV
ncbi:hypothetical protein L596_024700 [Steinernema carpocapsae]|uniref:MARVEL domain-containing protein n=1 Tax=Steinernema carpocapsae TaxID=34508 RepID=A0A4U5M5J8_STECR|nr:hypothetical protein L596_024700 [Steinernema carpocapsae]